MNRILTIVLVVVLTSSAHSQETKCIFNNCVCNGDIYDDRNDILDLKCKHPPFTRISNESHVIGLFEANDANLNDFPPNLLKNLEISDMLLSDNNLKRIRAGMFTGAKVTQLYLNQNQITEIEDGALMGLSASLKSLYLQKNKLGQMDTDRLSSETFNGLTKLKTLGLSNNELLIIPDLTHMLQLSDLQLYNNQIVDIMQLSPAKLLIPDNVVTLILNHNRINLLDPRAFKNLKKLKYLSLASNLINSINSETFKDLISLTNLDLSKNYIAHIPSGMILSNTILKRIDFSSQNRPIKKIDSYAFDRNTENQLENLDLSNNRIESLPDRAFCSHNPQNPYVAIKEVDLAANSFKHLNPCIMLQLAKGSELLAAKNEQQKPMVKFKVNTALYINYENIKCDCNVTDTAKIIKLDGECANQWNTYMKLNSYQCGLITALGSVEEINRSCNNLVQYNCGASETETASEVIQGDSSHEFSDPIESDNGGFKTPEPQIHNQQNTHTSSNNEKTNSNNKNDRDNKVTNKPSQIAGGINSANHNNLDFSLISAITLIAISSLIRF